MDWLRNVRTAGTATVTVDGKTYDVCEPEVISAATAVGNTLNITVGSVP